jgi:hypothetical protein
LKNGKRSKHRTFRQDALERGLPFEVVPYVPDFPMDFRFLDCLDQRYVVAFAQGRWSPDRGWVNNSSWADAYDEHWERKVWRLEQDMEFWLALSRGDQNYYRDPSIAFMYRDVVVTSIHNLYLRRLQELTKTPPFIMDSPASTSSTRSLKKQVAFSPTAQQQGPRLKRKSAVIPYWLRMKNEDDAAAAAAASAAQAHNSMRNIKDVFGSKVKQGLSKIRKVSFVQLH